jgi:hypothetical protein
MNKDEVFLQVAPEKIDMLTKLIEAYDNLGVVSTLDPLQGLVIIRATADTLPEIETILDNMPFCVVRGVRLEVGG